MDIPSSVPQVLSFLLLVVPGISFVIVRTRLRGISAPDQSVGARILEALYISVLFVGFYTLLGVALLRTGQGGLSRTANSLFGVLPPWFEAAALIALLFVIPALVAWLTFLEWEYRPRQHENGEVMTKKGRHLYEAVPANNWRSTPRAWDYAAFRATRSHFVVVRTAAQVYYGGWYGPESYVSTYPHGRDIFIQEQWHLTTDGKLIRPVSWGRGIWIPIDDACVVEWLESPPEDYSVVGDGRLKWQLIPRAKAPSSSVLKSGKARRR